MVCLYLYFELRAGGQQCTPTYFLVTRSSAFCISNPILDQLTGGTSQMGGFFCTFYCWLAACFLKSALWIINRLHKQKESCNSIGKQWLEHPPMKHPHTIAYYKDWSGICSSSNWKSPWRRSRWLIECWRDVIQHSTMKCIWRIILWNFGKHQPCDYI